MLPTLATAFFGFCLRVAIFAEAFGSSFFSVSSKAGFGIEWSFGLMRVVNAAGLTPEKMVKLARPGFKIVMYDTLEQFYLAEALEYITAWRESTSQPKGRICCYRR